MPFTNEQSEEIKKQLLTQVANLPNENKDQIIQHIQSLDEQQLEEFLKQNKIQISDTNQLAPEKSQETEKPIFEMIINGEIPSYKIAENNKSLAILELNPLSKGHSLVIPKQKTTTEKIPKSAMSLAQKIGKKIKSKLKPEDIKIETFSFQDYPAINIIPLYKDQTLNKTKAEESDLIKLQSKLETKKRSARKTKSKPSSISNLQEIKLRIPY